MFAELEKSKQAVAACFETVFSDFSDRPIEDAMRYAVAGGKGLRGFLVLQSAKLFDVDPTKAVWPATSIEAMHAYSLVHDDMPCMDDDDLRRGLPTVHVKWDEATAVLVGDALQSLSFSCLTHPKFAISSDIRVELIGSLAKSSGIHGMVLGQAQDIAAETAKTPLSLDEITALQENKTGALIEWSAAAGAVMAQEDASSLATYAQAIGLAFQIQDDVLDVEGDVSKTGKAVGKDLDAGKATFVSHLGLAGAKQRAQELVEQACEALAPYESKAQNLRELAQFVISRET